MMKLNIFAKFIIAMTLVIAAAVFIFFHEAQRTGRELLYSLSHSKAESLADLGLMTLEHQMIEDDQSEINRFLQSLSSSHQARSIRITDIDGKIVLSSDTVDPNTSISFQEYEDHPEMSDHRVKRVLVGSETIEHHLWPLVNEPKCRSCHMDEGDILGYAALEVSLADIARYAAQHRDSNIAITISIFSGLGISLILLLLFLVVRPVKRLQNHISQLEEHIPDLQEGKPLPFLAESDIRRSDEIAELARSFQKLVLRLNHAYEEITELHDQQLERADQLASVGEMAAGIAHEIKNPVSGVKAALQVFLREVEDDDLQKEILEEMIVQLNRINRAVNDLLSYVRVAPPEMMSLHVHDVIDKTASMLIPETKDREIELQLSLTTEDDVIRADPQQLQQVLWNIMLNATQSMNEGGKLTVSTKKEDGNLEISVSDTGKGLDAETMKNIYKPFFTTKCKGTGLGMAIVRRIMQQHGGGIHITSKEDQGTTVRLIFQNNEIFEE